MKPFPITLALIAALGLPLLAPAQGDPVTIIGELSDGTLPPPAPEPELSRVMIRETKVV
ncbi:MAG: hypothetical protein AAGA96_19305 [Verrucomicrobiota bacterium]